MNSGSMLFSVIRYYGWWQQSAPMFCEAYIDGGLADLLVISRAKYATEVEIKCSLADWKKDATKDKWRKPRPHIARFFYVVPAKLAARHPHLADAVPGAGLLTVDDDGFARELRPAQRFKAQKISQDMLLDWYRQHHNRFWFHKLHRLHQAQFALRRKEAA